MLKNDRASKFFSERGNCLRVLSTKETWNCCIRISVSDEVAVPPSREIGFAKKWVVIYRNGNCTLVKWRGTLKCYETETQL